MNFFLSVRVLTFSGQKVVNMQVSRVSHSCVGIELGPICNSMAASLCVKSYEDPTAYLKAIMKVYGKTCTGVGPSFEETMSLRLPNECPQRKLRSAFVSVQSGQQCHYCPHEDTIGPWLLIECAAQMSRFMSQ